MSDPMTTKTRLELICLRAALLVEYGWTQRASATDHRGIPTSPEDPKAVSWCATGAMARAAYEIVGKDEDAREAAYEEAELEIWLWLNPGSDEDDAEDHEVSIEDWNDEKGRTVEEVASLLRFHGLLRA